jgi:hypothetical protein
MISHPEIVQKYLKLTLGTSNKQIKCNREYMAVTSHFDDEWYNFIIPNLSDPSSINMADLQSDIEDYDEKNKKHSIYLNAQYKDEYSSWLESNGYELFGEDVYLVGEFTEPMSTEIPQEYVEKTDYSIDEVGNMLFECFPTWPEEIEYSRHFEKLKQDGQEDRVFESIVIALDDKPVAAASVVIDTHLGISYLHNHGTLVGHQRKGLHTSSIKSRINLSLTNNVNTLLSIVEKDSGSYRNLRKLGFEEKCIYLIYSKDN